MDVIVNTSRLIIKLIYFNFFNIFVVFYWKQTTNDLFKVIIVYV